MTNRIVVVVVALVVGAGFYAGATAVEDVLTPDPGGPVTGEVVATNATMHLDRVGRPTVVGEVFNGLNEPIGDVSAVVTFRSPDGERRTATGHVATGTVESGHRAPFVVRLEDRAARPTDFDVAVDYEAGAASPAAGARIVADRIADRGQSQVTVAGQVENRGRDRLSVHVVATFYDEDGSVIGVRSVPTSPGTLEPGAAGAFELRFRTLGNVPSRAGDVDDYALALEVERVEDG